MIKDKELTKRKLLNAVGIILTTKGYTALGVNYIAKTAGVDKRLIYRYFSSVQNLIETYILEKDYWLKTIAQPSISTLAPLDDQLSSLIAAQLAYCYHSEDMQGIIQWGLSEKNILLNSIARIRENIKSEFFERIDNEIGDTQLDSRAVSALLIAGSYYLSLHAKYNDSTFCELNIRKEEDRKRLTATIKQLVSLALKKKY